MIVTLLVFLAILGGLVFVHELGHFLVARWNGVWVREFAFGFRPRLFSKTIGDTEYALNAIPLGGYVRLYGELPEEIGERSFKDKTPWQRFQVLVAGSVMNLLLGWLLLTILFIVGFHPVFPGVDENPFISQTPSVLVSKVAQDSPADKASLQENDKITAVDGQALSTEKFITYVNDHRGQAVTLRVERNGSSSDVTLIPREDPPAGQGALGVALSQAEAIKTTPLKAPLAALYETGRIIGVSAAGFGLFLRDLVVHQQVSPNVTGLVGVGALTGVARRLGLGYLMQLVVMISVGLGVINLMPILPLDGGHIAALVYEKIAGRPLSERQFSGLITAGLVFVIFIFVLVTYEDILRFDVFSRLF